jgi:branched-chain amino acid aminotransferase
MLMELPHSETDFVKFTLDLVKAENFHTDCYIRPICYFRDEVIGVRLHGLNAEVAIVAIPFGSYVENEEGSHVTFSSWKRVDDNMIPARGKIAGAYVNSAFIKTDAQRSGFDEAIVLNQDGHISEGSAENFFIVRKGIVCTPPITENILEGITRTSLEWKWWSVRSIGPKYTCRKRLSSVEPAFRSRPSPLLTTVQLVWAALDP